MATVLGTAVLATVGIFAWKAKDDALAYWDALTWSRARRRGPCRTYRTVLDVEEASEAVALVELMSRGNRDTAAVAERLVRLYTRFPPYERQLQRLSLLQQRLEGRGGKEEFAVTTVYMLCSLALMERVSTR